MRTNDRRNHNHCSVPWRRLSPLSLVTFAGDSDQMAGPGDHPYRIKCQLLQQRCQVIQRDNERLIDLMHQTRSLINRLQRQQRVLVKRLSRHEPEFRTRRLPLFTEIRREAKQPAKGKTSSSTAASKRTSGKRLKTENGKEAKGMPLPKKALNPYLIYCSMQRSAVQEELQVEQKADMNNQELTKALALKWKFLTHDQKELYYRLYEQEKERYDKEMKLFAASSEKTG